MADDDINPDEIDDFMQSINQEQQVVNNILEATTSIIKILAEKSATGTGMTLDSIVSVLDLDIYTLNKAAWSEIYTGDPKMRMPGYVYQNPPFINDNKNGGGERPISNIDETLDALKTNRLSESQRYELIAYLENLREAEKPEIHNVIYKYLVMTYGEPGQFADYEFENSIPHLIKVAINSPQMIANLDSISINYETGDNDLILMDGDGNIIELDFEA